MKVELTPLTGSYQKDSKTDYESAMGSEDVDDIQDNSETLSSWFQPKRTWIYLMIGCFFFLSLAALLVHTVHMGTSSPISTDVLKSESNSYCKISCANSCAEYPV